MLYNSKIDDYLEILTNEEVKDFVAINFSESTKENHHPARVTKAPKDFTKRLFYRHKTYCKN